MSAFQRRGSHAVSSPRATEGEAAAARYVHDHGLVEARTDHSGAIVAPAGVVDALYLPRQFGDRVVHAMDARGLFTPVVVDMSDGSLAIITDGGPCDFPPAAHRPMNIHASKPLRSRSPRCIRSGPSSCRVQRTVRSSLITLPGPPPSRHQWRVPPRGRDREALATIADLIHSLGGHLVRSE